MKKIIYMQLVIIYICFHAKAQTLEAKNYSLYKNKFDSLSKLPATFPIDTLKLMCLDSIIESPVMIKKEKFDLYYDIYRRIAYRVKWKKGIARYKMFYGNYMAEKESVVGVKFLVEAENELEVLKDYPSQIYTLIRLSMALTHKTDSLSALIYLNKAIEIAKKIHSQKWLLKVLNYKGNYFMYRNQLDIAIPVFKEIGNFKNLEMKDKIVNDLNLGMCYINFKKVKEGMKYLNSTLAIMPKDISIYISLHIDVRGDLINYFIDVEKNYIKAQKYFEELKPFRNSTSISLGGNFEYYKKGYRIYKGLGDYKKALYFLEQRNIYDDSLKAESRRNGLEGIKSQLALREQTSRLQISENENLRSENERQKQLRWFLIVLSIAGLLTTLYILRTNKKLKVNNDFLLQKNKEISEAMLTGQTIERKRVASDLHDNLGSTMSSIRWAFQAIDHTKWSDNEKDIFSNVQMMFDKAYDDIRLLSHNLLPEEFERLGLATTLQNFIRKINKNTAIHFDLKVEHEFVRVDKKVEFELYSICLELVNNIMKHSKATEAMIDLSQTKNQIKLIVSDNGIGIFKNDSDGKGMKNVQARVESLNGIWNIQNAKNEGVVNEILIPV